MFLVICVAVRNLVVFLTNWTTAKWAGQENESNQLELIEAQWGPWVIDARILANNNKEVDSEKASICAILHSSHCRPKNGQIQVVMDAKVLGYSRRRAVELEDPCIYHSISSILRFSQRWAVSFTWRYLCDEDPLKSMPLILKRNDRSWPQKYRTHRKVVEFRRSKHPSKLRKTQHIWSGIYHRTSHLSRQHPSTPCAQLVICKPFQWRAFCHKGQTN